MGKVSAAKKQRDKKKLDKMLQRKEKEDKMRKVLASLEVISKTNPEKNQSKNENQKQKEEK